tara:strand:- start:2026 stop:2760 length:735 start_codon:yes stop_codon:yes gene_type:complete
MNIVVSVLLILIFFLVFKNNYDFFKNDKKQFIQIAHGGGLSKDNIIYTNSPETVLYNYNNNFRYFEIDVIFGKNKTLVAHHDHPYYSKLIDILQIIDIHNDITFILDIRNPYIKILQKLINYIEINKKTNYYNNIILQVYSIDDVNFVKKTKFNKVLFAYWRNKPDIKTVYKILKLIDSSRLKLFGISLFNFGPAHPSNIFNSLKKTKYNKFIFFHGNLKTKEDILKIKKLNYNVFSQYKYINE